MKRKYLIVGTLAFLQFVAKAQAPKDTTILSKTAIELVYNHYAQTGNNSAVTGGTGTEKLTIYGPQLNITKTKGKNSLNLNVGSDIISSASTDNIDFIVSSASIIDARTHAAVEYDRNIEKHNLVLSGGASASIESDYFSIGTKIGLSKQDKKRLSTYSLFYNQFNDDLRWGRLDEGVWKAQKLIYPQELRYKEWFNFYKRNSYNLKLGYTRIINKRTIVGVFPEFTLQRGLLSTPFHRVYFNDGTIKVENLPTERLKNALGLKLNRFVKGNIILKNTLNGYTDNFGINAFSIENETALKLKSYLTLLVNARFYKQAGSNYFKKYQEHSITEQYYTSDYDLSKIETYTFGVGIKYSPYKYLKKNFKFNSFIFRYNYMQRSNLLAAHILSLSITTEFIKKADPKP
jgi:hypothetical protein